MTLDAVGPNNLSLSSTSGASSYTFELPEDIVSLFFSFLNGQNQISLGGTCKSFYAIYLNTSPLRVPRVHLFSALESPVIALAKAVKEREFTAKEWRGTTFKESPQPSSVSEIRADEPESQKFLTTFLKKLTDLKIDVNSKNFAVFVKFARQMITSGFRDAVTEDGNTNSNQLIKLGTVTPIFNSQLLSEICNTYADKDTSEITIESFKEQRALIHDCIPNIKSMDSEAALRRAVLAKHTGKMAPISTQYANAVNDKTNALFVSVKAALEAKLNGVQGTTGTTSDTEEKLEPIALDDSTQRELQRIANFYSEINIPIIDMAKERRSWALNKIIN